ncbi:MAG TPA: low affinity iron permease family protein [Humisphaera sp.]
MNERFRKFAAAIAAWCGSPACFIIAVMLIVAWAFSRPLFQSFDTWQLVINTATTIVTFLMVFLIQNTQNREAKSIHLKLDELIKATKGARNKMIDLDRLTDVQLKTLEEEYKRICDRDEVSPARAAVREELKEREIERKQNGRHAHS